MTGLEDVSDEVLTTVLRVAAQGDYQLLLGAGASVGSKNKFGSKLPDGPGLSEMLSTRFKLSPDPNLVRTYERACRNGKEDDVYNFFRDSLSGCVAADWYEQLTALPWRRIWTLNIDDVVEGGFEAHRKTAWSYPEPLRWSDPFTESTGTQIVHLHGYVKPSKPAPLVFSMMEYIAVRSAKGAWHPVFGDMWEERPFIVVGARLVDEYDLADVFRTRKPKHDVPCLYVARTIDDTMREDLIEWGLTPVECDAETFFKQLHEMVSPNLRRAERAWSKSTDNRASVIFSQQFRQLTSDSIEIDEPRHDLYRGDPPLWIDIVKERAASLEWVEAAAKETVAVVNAGQRRVVAELRERLSGRSTGLLAAAARLEANGLHPMLFRGEQALNVDAAFSVISNNPQLVLLFDGLADQARPIDKLMERCKAASVGCAVLGVERAVRAPVLWSALSEEFFDEWSVVGAAGSTEIKRSSTAIGMSYVDAKSMVDKLDSMGRLEFIEPLSTSERIKTFRSNGVFAAMEVVSHGPNFRRRIAAEIAKIDRPEILILLLLVSLVDNADQVAQKEVVDVIDRLGYDAVDLAEPAVAEFVIVRGQNLLARHRSLALNSLVEAVGKDEILAAISGYMKFIRPYVNNETLRQGTYHASLARGLLRARALEHWVGLNRLEEFYESLVDEYSWNSRFWEQRAIAAELNRDWARATSYGSRAATMTPDDHRSTTFASILVNRAIDTEEAGSKSFLDMVVRGMDQFKQAHNFRRSNPVPVQIALAAMVRVAESLHSSGAPIPRDLVARWNQWQGHAEAMHAFAAEPLSTTYSDLKTRWIKVCIS